MASDIEKKNDEVDLLELFQRMFKVISGWVSGLLKIITFSIIFIVRKWIPLGLGFIISIALTFGAKKTFTALYKTEMAIKSNTVPNADMIAYINRLHSFSMGRNLDAISKSLSVSAEVADALKDIEAFWVIDMNKDDIPDYVDYKNSHDVYDTLNLRMSDRLVISARVTSLQHLPAIRKGLFRYITTDSIISHQNDVRLARLDEMQKRISYDIKQLDSLQKVKYFEETRNRAPDKTNQMIFLQPQNTQLLTEDIYSLYSRKQQIDEEKNLDAEPITLISDFTIPANQYNGLKYYGKFIIPFVLGLTLLILILTENRRRLKDFFASQTE